MQHLRKIRWLTLVLIMAVVTACGGGNAQNQQSDSSTGAGSDTPDNTVDAPEPSGERPTVEFVVNNGPAKYPGGMDENNNPYIEYIREGSNVDLRLITPPSEGYQDRLNVIMASGDLPDMIHTKDEAFFINYVNQKAFQSLNDAIDKYGANLKRLIPEEAWENVTIDGQIYAVPALAKIRAGEMMFARKDWLDKVGLEPPKTLDEYTRVIQAFAEEDPDGNGKNDTFGLILEEKLFKTQPFFGAFGVQRGQWYDRDGELVYSGILPEMKQALEYLAGLFANGWIDPEWPLNKNANSNEKIANGKVGLYAALWHETRGAMLTNKNNDPNAEWIRLEYPVGPEGKSGGKGPETVAGYNVVPVSSNKADIVIQVLDFLIQEEHYKTLNFGFEGEVYEIVDGEMVTNFDEHNKHIYRQTLHQLVEPPYGEVLKTRHDSLGKEFNLVDNVEFGHRNLIESDFLGTATPAMGKYLTNLTKLEEEYFTKIIMGTIPVDDFDKFVAEWKRTGGDEIAKEVNEWYRMSKASK